MKPLAIDFGLINTQLLLFVLLLITAGGGILALHDRQESQHQVLLQLESSVAGDRQNLQTRQEGQQLYKQIAATFQAAFPAAQAAVDKLSWMEQFQALNSRLSLPGLSYNIKPRYIDDALNLALSNGFGVYSTPMEIKTGLLHEGQLLRLADHLAAAGLGLFSFESCRLKREKERFASAGSNVEASCSLVWYEIVRSDAMQAEVAGN